MILSDVRSALSGPVIPKINDTAGLSLASVLVVIYGRDPAVIMTKKSTHLRIHAGEVSFPGERLTTTLIFCRLHCARPTRRLA